MTDLPYRNARLSPEARTDDIISRMTIDEKIGQLLKMDGFRSYRWVNGQFEIRQEWRDFMSRYPAGTMSVLLRADWWTEIGWDNGIPPSQMRMAVTRFQQYAYDHSRLRIPIYLMEEAGHGLMALGATVFPTGIGLGAMWDAELINRVGRVIGSETHAAGIQAVHGPVLDIIRDIRWSRCEENYAEDPYLTARYAHEIVRGLSEAGVVATLKHFCAHGSPEGGHNSAPAHVGPVELCNCQLRPFLAGIRAGARSVMSSYNTVDGESVTADPRYLTYILRDRLGFDGFVVSDRGAIPMLMEQRICTEPWECSARALKAGCDVDNGHWEFHAAGLAEALRRGAVTEEDLDRSVRRVLKLKFELGLFENPCPGADPVEVLRCAAHRETAREAARKCLTLLKNDGVLPLSPIWQKLAVIGPNADRPMNQIGDYSAPQQQRDVETPLAGICRLAKERNVTVQYAAGCSIRGRNRDGFAQALAIAAEADAILYFPGGSSTKYGTGMSRTATGAAISEILPEERSDKESGEGTDRATLHYSGVQMELLRELCATGKPVICVPIQGRPLLMEQMLNQSAAVLLAWYPGEYGGGAIAETLFGQYNPAGRLPVSLPRAEGQLPLYYNTTQPRRDYVDLTGAPLLPFGFGLSYTTFEYTCPTVTGRQATVTVTNTGDRDGDEVVQFYLTDLAATIQRPVLELIGFERIFLRRGESKTVTCHLTDEVLGFYDREMNFRLEPGAFRLGAGANSESLKTVEFTL